MLILCFRGQWVSVTKTNYCCSFKIFCLHPYIWCLDSPGWHRFAAVLNAALMDYSTNASAENACQTHALWDCFQVTMCSFSAPKQLYWHMMKSMQKSAQYWFGKRLHSERQRRWDKVQLFAASLCPSNCFLMEGCSWETIWLLHLPLSLSCNTWYTEAMTT